MTEPATPAYPSAEPHVLHGQLPLTQPPSPRRPLLVGLAVVLVTAVGVGVAAALGAFSTPAPKTFSLPGGIMVPSSDAIDPAQTPCSSSGGYSDINPGVAVTIANAQGQTIATGALAPGVLVVSSDGTTRTCLFTFSVPGVPDGLTSYLVTISHRGTQVVSSDEAHHDVLLTLGGG